MIETIDKYPIGLTIACGNYQGRLCGLTLRTFALASVNPLIVSVAIAPERYSQGIIKQAEAFSVNILAEDQIKLARLFGMASGSGKFDSVEYRLGQTQSPILTGSAGYLDCLLEDVYTIGDHDLFFGRVVGASVDRSKVPYLYSKQDFNGGK